MDNHLESSHTLPLVEGLKDLNRRLGRDLTVAAEMDILEELLMRANTHTPNPEEGADVADQYDVSDVKMTERDGVLWVYPIQADGTERGAVCVVGQRLYSTTELWPCCSSD